MLPLRCDPPFHRGWTLLLSCWLGACATPVVQRTAAPRWRQEAADPTASGSASWASYRIEGREARAQWTVASFLEALDRNEPFAALGMVTSRPWRTSTLLLRFPSRRDPLSMETLLASFRASGPPAHASAALSSPLRTGRLPFDPARAISAAQVQRLGELFARRGGTRRLPEALRGDDLLVQLPVPRTARLPIVRGGRLRILVRPEAHPPILGF